MMMASSNSGIGRLQGSERLALAGVHVAPSSFQVLERAFPALGGREDCFVLRLLLLNVGGSDSGITRIPQLRTGGFPTLQGECMRDQN